MELYQQVPYSNGYIVYKNKNLIRKVEPYLDYNLNNLLNKGIACLNLKYNFNVDLLSVNYLDFTIKFKAKEFADEFLSENTGRTSMFNIMRRAIKNNVQSYEVTDENVRSTSLITHIDYHWKNDYVLMSFNAHPSAMPYLFPVQNIGEQYIRYDIRYISGLQLKEILLYENILLLTQKTVKINEDEDLLVQDKYVTNFSGREINLSSLKEYLNATSYNNVKFLKLIDKYIENINKKTDIYVTYEVRKNMENKPKLYFNIEKNAINIQAMSMNTECTTSMLLEKELSKIIKTSRKRQEYICLIMEFCSLNGMSIMEKYAIEVLLDCKGKIKNALACVFSMILTSQRKDSAFSEIYNYGAYLVAIAKENSKEENKAVMASMNSQYSKCVTEYNMKKNGLYGVVKVKEFKKYTKDNNIYIDKVFPVKLSASFLAG